MFQSFNFKKDGFIIINKAINKDLAIFIYNYFLIKRQVAETFLKHNFISETRKFKFINKINDLSNFKTILSNKQKVKVNLKNKKVWNLCKI